MKITPRLPVLFAALALAGAARAETAAPAPDLLTAHLAHPSATPVRPGDTPLDLSRPQTAFGVTYEGAGPARIPGVARTSVDRRLASDDVIGSLGFLCGLEPGAGKDGGAAARGYDPSGRFVGAKLRLAFR